MFAASDELTLRAHPPASHAQKEAERTTKRERQREAIGEIQAMYPFLTDEQCAAALAKHQVKLRRNNGSAPY